ncbi:MAG TPA: NfeD family protein [Acidimicrobiia bacterium]|nr:NfeD family protein [Acidimicrobiia bacterium]
MADRWDLIRVVESCERYWRESGVPHRASTEMRLQLEEHLSSAMASGRPIESVIGTSLPEFAENWASEYRLRPTATWDDVTSGRTGRDRAARRELITYGAGITLVVAAVALAANGGDQVENDVWRWLWTAFAVVMGIGEIFTAGFFLLPFAIGAAAAAVLAWLGVALLPQWLVFFGVSLVAMVYLRRFIARQDQGDQPAVGANRWANLRGTVLETIDPIAVTGLVKIGGEEWRATTEGPLIPAGTEVVVKEVRGARLLVVPKEEV